MGCLGALGAKSGALPTGHDIFDSALHKLACGFPIKERGEADLVSPVPRHPGPVQCVDTIDLVFQRVLSRACVVFRRTTRRRA